MPAFVPAVVAAMRPAAAIAGRARFGVEMANFRTHQRLTGNDPLSPNWRPAPNRPTTQAGYAEIGHDAFKGWAGSPIGVSTLLFGANAAAGRIQDRAKVRRQDQVRI